MRHEFSRRTRLAALERSGGRCEAAGPRYGFPENVRCQRLIGPNSFDADHYPRPAHDPHPDTTTIGNCVAVCKECNRWANNNIDTPREAKIKRVARREQEHAAVMAEKTGMFHVKHPEPTRKRPRKKIQSRGFQPGKSRPIPNRPFPKGPKK